MEKKANLDSPRPIAHFCTLEAFRVLWKKSEIDSFVVTAGKEPTWETPCPDSNVEYSFVHNGTQYIVPDVSDSYKEVPDPKTMGDKRTQWAIYNSDGGYGRCKMHFFRPDFKAYLVTKAPKYE
jgi:hypothetical protein